MAQATQPSPDLARRPVQLAPRALNVEGPLLWELDFAALVHDIGK